MLVLGMCTGMLIGALLVNMELKEEKRVNGLLKSTINNLEDEIGLLNSKVKSRDKLINDLQDEAEILLENASEQRTKEIDYINNIDFLVDQLPENKKELVRPSQQN